MSVPCEKMIPINLPSYSQLLVDYDPQHSALWYYLNPNPRPCFTPTLLGEIRDLQQRVAEYLSRSPGAISYLVLASATPGVFNLGGDLDLFTRCIRERDRAGLHQYGRTCIDAVYHNATNLGIPSLTTISLVQGSALGGGFEAALSGNVVIAEESAELGFPEIMFNLFPGMGAYSLLARRIGGARTERLLRSGALNTAKSLHDLGVVDELCRSGEGVHAANEFIRRHERSRNGQQAIQMVRQRVFPLQYQELIDIVDIWVDAALRLTTRDLRMMGKFISAQSRLEKSNVGTIGKTERNEANVYPHPTVAAVAGV